MSAVGGKALEAITKFLADKKKLELLKQTTDNLSNVADHAESLLGFQNAINTFLQFFTPLSVPLQILAAEMGSEVLGDNINLMNTMLELMKNENVQKGIGAIVHFLKFLTMEFGARLYILGRAIDLFDSLINKLEMINEGLSDFIDKIEDSKTKLGSLVSWLKELADSIDEATDKLRELLEGGENMSPTKWEMFKETVPDVVKPLFGLLGWFALL